MHHTARRHMLEVCLGSSVARLWLVCGQAEDSPKEQDAKAVVDTDSGVVRLSHGTETSVNFTRAAFLGPLGSVQA